MPRSTQISVLNAAVLVGSIAKSQISTTGRWVWTDLPVGSYFNSTATPSKSTTSLTAVMAGFGWVVTPSKTGILQINVRGVLFNNTTGDGARIRYMKYGTGAAPVNGDADTGTSPLPADATGIDNTTNVANGAVPFAFQCYTPALSLVATWIDFVMLALTGGTASIDRAAISVQELSA